MEQKYTSSDDPKPNLDGAFLLICIGQQLSPEVLRDGQRVAGVGLVEESVSILLDPSRFLLSFILIV